MRRSWSPVSWVLAGFFWWPEVKRTLVSLAALAAVSAHAGGMVVRSEYAAQQSIIQAAKSGSDSTFTRLVNQSYKVGMSDLVRFPGPAGAAIEGRLALALTEKGAMTVAARALALAGPAGVTAMGLYTLYELYKGIRVQGDGQGGLLFDEGWGTEMQQQYCYPAGAFHGVAVPKGCAASPMAAGGQIVASHPYGTRNLRCSESACTFEAAEPWNYYYGTQYYTVTWRIDKTEVPICPELPGQFRPPIGFDGKCESTMPPVVISPEEAANKRTGAPGLPPIDYPKLMPDVMKGYGPDGFPIPEDTGYEMPAPGITPSLVKGPTTTTTKPDGSTQEDTEEWRASTANSIGGPNGNRLVVPWGKTTTTTTRDPQGNATGTTTATTNPGTTPSGSGAGGGTSDPKDPCVADPGRLGCIGLGAIPPEPALTTVTPEINRAPDAGWGASNGTCPAPRSVTLLGHAMVVDNTVLCTWLVNIRFLILFVASIAAIKITIGGMDT